VFVFLSDELVKALVRDREEEARETRPHSHPHKPLEDDRPSDGSGGLGQLWLRLKAAHAK